MTPADVQFTLKDPNVLKPESSIGQGIPFTLNLSCPHCNRLGSFSPLPDIADANFTKLLEVKTPTNALTHRTVFTVGLRSCPNIECRSLIAFSAMNDKNGRRVIKWVAPPELIDFRTDNVPSKISDSMREAIASHSVQAYRASALMVRRTLELLCEDKGATGKDLRERISKLSQHVVISPALLSAADQLRLLGNDAAHVEAKTYDDVDQEHSQLAIELAKEILKAVYQHDDLVARLTRLKRP